MTPRVGARPLLWRFGHGSTRIPACPGQPIPTDVLSSRLSNFDEEAFMLGDNLGTVKGRITSRRVLDTTPGAARTESSQEGGGTLLGVAMKEMTSYGSDRRPDGRLYGSGGGIYMGEGGEMATWQGSGIGTFKEDGGVSFRGALYLYSTTPKWQRLNAVACLFEYEVDAEGNYSGTLFEWK
jgi:hypothetical protein